MAWSEVQRMNHEVSVKHGFWDHVDEQLKALDLLVSSKGAPYVLLNGLPYLGIQEKLALIHAEVSEALEAVRIGNPPDDKIHEFTGLEVELADVVIRIMDLAERYKLRVAETILAKGYYNQSRPKMHGKKF